MSLFRAAVGLARWILLRAQKTSLHGRGGYSSDSLAARGCASRFPQAEVERGDVGAFFGLFADSAVAGSLRDRVVLDFGSGYGGKTVEYRRQYCARRVCGIEPFANMVEKSREYAAACGARDVEFAVCGHRDIPYPDESFDVVVSHDVLEHVADPLISMREIRRVLRPGGLSLNVFPVYFGAMSHHLDYIARVPGLHWFFSPSVLVQAVNSILEQDDRYGTATQPPPGRSFDGARDVLPGLNGLSGEHLEALFSGFEVVNVRRIALGPRGMGLIARSSLPVRVRDGVTATIACVLRKPADRADG